MVETYSKRGIWEKKKRALVGAAKDGDIAERALLVKNAQHILHLVQM